MEAAGAGVRPSPGGSGPALRLRTSRCGAVFYERGRVVWNDYLDHREFAVAPGTEQVLRDFADWRTYTPAAARHSDREHRIIAALREHDILHAEGTDRHRREDAVVARWGQWGPVARAFHYATRTTAQTPYLTPEEGDRALPDGLPADPPPAAFRSGAGPAYPLPLAAEAAWADRDLLSVLADRRSRRSFGSSMISVSALGAMLDLAGRATGFDERTQTVFKASPSGGGRHPTDIYACALRVADLAPGIYRYDGRGHALNPVGPAPSPARLIRACGDQDWVADAGLLFFYTSVLARNTWKYKVPRSYRVLQLDAGHLNQTLYLAVTALGLSMTFTAALRDQLVEELLGCDPAGELVLGGAVIGSPG